ncbi:MAG: hypothetical protein AAF360_08410, partial [Pseudomonadota bacterium]
MTHDAPREAAEVIKTSLTGFLNEIKDFKTEIQTKMKEQDQRIGAMPRTPAHRPALAAANEAPAHKSAMATYLRAGDDALILFFHLGLNLRLEILDFVQKASQRGLDHFSGLAR